MTPSYVCNGDWVENFREQERKRYKHPTQPWIYILQNGTRSIVAPVAKKATVSMSSKARDHPLLKKDRPQCITILSLVRDAACRMPGGKGTRSEICDLIRESQYVNEKISSEKMSNIVSGALDRLHYESDPCVKYDSEKKLWIYLHKEAPGGGIINIQQQEMGTESQMSNGKSDEGSQRETDSQQSSGFTKITKKIKGNEKAEMKKIQFSH